MQDWGQMSYLKPIMPDILQMVKHELKILQHLLQDF